MKTIRVEYNYTVVGSGRIFKILYIDKDKTFIVVMYEDNLLERIGYDFFQKELDNGEITLNKKCHSKRELIDALLDVKKYLEFRNPYIFEHMTKIGLVRVYIDKLEIQLFTLVDSEYVDAVHPLTEEEFKEFEYK